MSDVVVPFARDARGRSWKHEGLAESVEDHPAGKGVSPERRALLEAEKWSMRIVIAREGYAEALDECQKLGLTPTEIARTVGKTEAAIRQHFKRRNQ